jgi:hypothetical protein
MNPGFMSLAGARRETGGASVTRKASPLMIVDRYLHFLRVTIHDQAGPPEAGTHGIYAVRGIACIPSLVIVCTYHPFSGG